MSCCVQRRLSFVGAVTGKTCVGDDACKNRFTHNILFVSGFHHTGTTLLQHQLHKHVTGEMPKVRMKELWIYPVGCSHLVYRRGRNKRRYRSIYPKEDEFVVLKHPVNTLDDFNMMLGMRDSFPNIKIAWMQRNLGSSVWSYFKRFFKYQLFLPKGAPHDTEDHYRVSHKMNATWFRKRCHFIVKQVVAQHTHTHTHTHT